MNNKPSYNFWGFYGFAVPSCIVALSLLGLVAIRKTDAARAWQRRTEEAVAQNAVLRKQIDVERDRVADAQAALTQARRKATEQMLLARVQRQLVEAQMAEAQRQAALQAIAAQKHIIRTEGR